MLIEARIVEADDVLCAPDDALELVHYDLLTMHVDEIERVAKPFSFVARRDGIRFELIADTTPEAFLQAVLATGASVRRFERLRPTLDEVFVRAVRGA